VPGSAYDEDAVLHDKCQLAKLSAQLSCC